MDEKVVFWVLAWLGVLFCLERANVTKWTLPAPVGGDWFEVLLGSKSREERMKRVQWSVVVSCPVDVSGEMVDGFGAARGVILRLLLPGLCREFRCECECCR